MQVAALTGRIYGPGDNIIVEGDVGREMYFLESGEVQVRTVLEISGACMTLRRHHELCAV